MMPTAGGIYELVETGRVAVECNWADREGSLKLSAEARSNASLGRGSVPRRELTNFVDASIRCLAGLRKISAKVGGL
jgi:hypothetical protein